MKVTTFGEHIRSLRENADLTLKVVAEQLNIDTSLLGKIERNERNPSKNVIKKLAEIFGEDEDFLVSEHLSDQIAFKVLKEDSDTEVLKVAEEKVKYLKSKKNG